MSARIYDGAEARALREAFLHSAPGIGYAQAGARIRNAAPDLAASVEHYARRAEKAEAELIEAHDRARDAEAERAAAEAALTAVWQAVTDDDLPRLPDGDGTVVDAEVAGQRVAAVVAERDALRAAVREVIAAEREYERDPAADSSRCVAAFKALAALAGVRP